MIIAETERLVLRKFEQIDATVFYQMNSNHQVLKYTGDLPFESIDTASLFISKYNHYETHDYGRWSVVLKSTNKCIGWCGLKNTNEVVDIGFRFMEKYWNQGFATESAQTALSVGFERYGLKRIIGRCAIENEASARVLQKVGMQQWKRDDDLYIGPIDIYQKFNESS